MGTMAATPAYLRRATVCPHRYRPRNPRATSLYQVLEAHYETVKGPWEERFERRYGFWRGFYDTAVARYLDCGLSCRIEDCVVLGQERPGDTVAFTVD